MTIKEAIERGPMVRQRNIIHHSVYQRDANERLNKTALEQGVALMQDTGALGMLQELTEEVRESYPDVQLQDPMLIHGKLVDVSLRWNFHRRATTKAQPTFDEVSSRISVSASVAAQELIVVGREGFGEVISVGQSDFRGVLEDAIAYAYAHCIDEYPVHVSKVR